MTGDSKDESMGAISRTCEESVPLYISILGWRNVNLVSSLAHTGASICLAPL